MATNAADGTVTAQMDWLRQAKTLGVRKRSPSIGRAVADALRRRAAGAVVYRNAKQRGIVVICRSSGSPRTCTREQSLAGGVLDGLLTPHSAAGISRTGIQELFWLIAKNEFTRTGLRHLSRVFLNRLIRVPGWPSV